MDGGVGEVGVVEVGGFAGGFVGDGEEAGGEGLFPFEGKGGHVADDEVELLLGGVAGERHGVEAGAADGAVGEEAVDGDVAFAPALCEAVVFEDRNHEAVVTRALHVNVADGGGDGGGCGKRAGGAEGLLREFFEGGADGDVFHGRRGKIHADVGPAHVAIDALRDAFDVEGGFGECVGEFLAGGVEVLGILEDGVNGVGGFERDGELVAEAGDVGGGEKWSERLDHGNGGEMEIGLAAVGVFEALDDAGGGADGAPADSVVAGDDEAAVEGFCAGEDFGE